jgi:hypothetical protein
MRRIFFPFLVILLSILVGYPILSLWRGVSLYMGYPLKDKLLQSIKVNPSNPDPFYRLSLFYQFDIQNVDLSKSLEYLNMAIKRDPLEQEYWLNLAKVLQRTGEQEASERALEKAILTFPTGYRGRWMAANLLLQQGGLEKAILHFSYILTHYPSQSSLIYDVLFKAINDTEFFLKRVVPQDPSSYQQYLSYLYEIGDKESVKKAWGRKASFGFKGDRSETLRHIDFLISHGDLNEAFLIWKEKLQEEGIPIPSDGNLITNGGFEKEKILGGGFDWRIDKISGVEVSFDPTVAFDGRHSLKITFNGKENVDYHHIQQYVALKPNTDYLLKARMKTKAITTKSGLKIEISGIGQAFHSASESLIGDNGWKELMIAFRAPAHSQGALVRVSREKTEKFDRFISGTVWLDKVELKEVLK